MRERFTLRAHFTDGRSILLKGSFETKALASRAAARYASDFADIDDLGVAISHVDILNDTNVVDLRCAA